ncbi:XRE family transcriptional regulator [Coprobacillus sp. AF21-8LB]|nr:XRE family transcriptional regulator [Coprobacillus sp. AF21-8LB]
MQQIGDRIYFLRKQLNLSQRAFGEKIGIKKASMSSIEKNKSNPSTQTIKLICIEFNVSYDWLLDGVGDIFLENNDSIHERIKFLRKNELKMTQIEFGKRLGSAGPTIVGWEKGDRTPPEATIKLICNEFNVNYDWLVNGVGDIFIENNDSIELLKNDYDLEDSEVRVIKAFLNLNKVERKVLVYYLEKAFGKDGQ